MNTERYKMLMRTFAEIVLLMDPDEEPLDGDQTEDLSKIFLKELDELSGNE